MFLQALANEVLAGISDGSFGRELNFSCVEDGLIFKDRLLGLLVSERFPSKKQLVEDHAH
jgi:hypothetical protein